MSFDLTEIRKDFPILNQPKPLVYFDNACVTLKPQAVIEAMSRYYTDYPACGGRSGHRLGERVTQLVDETRQAVAKFLNARSAKEVIFLRNATEGINLLARSFDWQPGDQVLGSAKEHNSNLVPWLYARDTAGLGYITVGYDADGQFDWAGYEELLRQGKVRLVAMQGGSNLDGTSLELKRLIDLAHKYGALVLIDAAQLAPHRALDVQALDVDFLVLSGHKLLGPSGTGILYGKLESLEGLKPFLLGGSTVSQTTYESFELLPVPERFEAGLQDYAGIIGLGAAIKYLERIGWAAIAAQELRLNAYVTDALQGETKLRLIGPKAAEERGAIFNFYVPGLDHHQIAIMLDRMSGILVRSGQHCVHSWFKANGLNGSVRASFYFYNTLDEAELFVETVHKIIKLA